MPKNKIKTKKSVAKRIKLTSKGKMMRGSAFMNHFLSKKSASTQREKSKNHEVHATNQKTVKKALGL